MIRKRPQNRPPVVPIAVLQLLLALGCGQDLLHGLVLSAQALPAGQVLELEKIQIPVEEFVFEARAAGPAEGELVLLLHGFPQTSYAYRHQLAALAQAGYRAVAPDLRGYSPGARPEEIEAYTMSELVGDVIGFADALGRDTFHLVGHDWGGAIAWVVATRFPKRLETLTVLSTPHFAAFSAALADPASEQSRRSSYFQVFGAEGAEERFLANDASLFRSVFQGGGLSDEDIQVYLDALGTPQALRAALNYYAALVGGRAPVGSNPSPSSSVSPVGVPTLYVFSTEDGAFSRETAEESRRYVSGPYRFEVLQGISHWVPEQASDRVNDLLLEHLKNSPGVPREDR